MIARNDKTEGGILPLATLLGLILVILVNGTREGFFNRPKGYSNTTHLVVAVPASVEMLPIYQEAVDRFQRAHPDITVELRPILGGNYYQKLLVVMASGNSPDLMWMGQSFGEFAQRGAFLDITDRVKQDADVTRIVPVALSWYRVGGRQLGVPFLIDSEFIVYNKDLFDSAGIPYPTNDWNYDDFLADARKLTSSGAASGRVNRYGYYGQLDPLAFGAGFISSDGTHAICDSPEMVRCLDTNAALVDKYHVTPSIQQQWQGAIDQDLMFTSGHVAMMQAFTRDLSRLRQQCGAMRYGIVSSPAVDRRAKWASSQAILISAQTKYPDAAWQLCQEFFGKEFEQKMASVGLPTDLRLAKILAATGYPQFSHLPVLLQAVDELAVTPRVAHLSEVIQIYNEACESVWTHQSTPEAAMQRASQLIDQMLQQYQRFES